MTRASMLSGVNVIEVANSQEIRDISDLLRKNPALFGAALLRVLRRAERIVAALESDEAAQPPVADAPAAGYLTHPVGNHGVITG